MQMMQKRILLNDLSHFPWPGRVEKVVWPLWAFYLLGNNQIRISFHCRAYNGLDNKLSASSVPKQQQQQPLISCASWVNNRSERKLGQGTPLYSSRLIDRSSLLPTLPLHRGTAHIHMSRSHITHNKQRPQETESWPNWQASQLFHESTLRAVKEEMLYKQKQRSDDVRHNSWAQEFRIFLNELQHFGLLNNSWKKSKQNIGKKEI